MRFAWIFLAALFSVALGDKAHLIVRKSLVGDFAVQGKNATIQVEIFNAGDRCAHLFVSSSSFHMQLDV